MKIDKAIVSSDDNKFYLDFWPLVSKVWKEKFNIKPVLLYVSDSDFEPTQEYGEVVRYKPLKDYPIYLQTLWVRYYHPTTEKDTTWILSDIDMFPISKDYFINRIQDFDNNQYVHIDPSLGEYKKLPSCYHIATGKRFTEVLDLPNDWEMSLWRVHSSNLGSDPGGHLTGKSDWFADERYATNKILNCINMGDKNIKFVNRSGGRYGHRLDRENFNYTEQDLKNGLYYDSHSIRPYEQYKEKIDLLVKQILESKC
jgi:hypothetical protein